VFSPYSVTPAVATVSKELPHVPRLQWLVEIAC
jgi:hypothetical protein